MTIRTRFAPSPTGDLHVGSVRTALYSWLYARKHQGTFILRIEDTDLERSTEASTRGILAGMAWVGLDHDEGPFYQSQRFDRYRAVIQQLLSSGQAYYCYCSKERLETLRQAQFEQKQKPRYDGHCRDKQYSHREGAVVRFCNPLSGDVIFQDQVYGEICVKNEELDDLIIARGDGSPTYNFTVVVDDYDMKITHVIRGDDHINNTPRQMNILRALKAEPPIYAHLPMILGSDGKRLSKRHGAVSILGFREAGFLPEAMLNYLVRLGWAHKDQEIFSMEEMIQLFDVTAVNRSPAAFDFKKLEWLNQHYLKTTPPARLAERVIPFFLSRDLPLSEGPPIESLIPVLVDRCKTLQEMYEKSHVFYLPVVYDATAVEKHLTSRVAPVLTALQEKLKILSPWTTENIHQLLQATIEQFQLKMPELAQPLRVAVTGSTTSPSIDVTLFLLGREKVLLGLSHAMSSIAQRH